MTEESKDEGVHGPTLADCIKTYLDSREHELSPKALARLKTVNETDDPTNEINAAWGVRVSLLQMLRAHGPNG